MKRRQFLEAVTALPIAFLGLSCDKKVHLEEDFFNRENIMGNDNKNFYFKYEIKPGKFIAVRVDSMEVFKNQYTPGDYTLIHKSEGFNKKRVYELKKQ